MPLYVFECTFCKTFEERLCKFCDIEYQRCNVCHELIHRDICAEANKSKNRKLIRHKTVDRKGRIWKGTYDQ